MNKSTITTDAVEVYNAFAELTSKEMKKALISGVRKAASGLVKETKSSLRSSGLKKVNKINPKYNNTLLQGIRKTKVWENRNGDIVSKVRIDSDRKSGSGTFRLQILEVGNYKNKRYAYTKTKAGIKKPSYRGDIKAYNFFKFARASYESKMRNEMNTAINNAVNKINSKKFGK